MRVFKFRTKQLGPHTHVNLFVGREDQTMAWCGKIVFRNAEWLDFDDLLRRQTERGTKVIIEEDK